MLLAVFGATGGTGRQVVLQALDRGHEVVALAREPAAVGIDHPRLRVVRGDVLVAADVAAVVDGAGAVISALGIGYRRHATVVYSAGTANIISAMTAGPRRLLVVSTSSLRPPSWRRPIESLLAVLVLHPILRRPYADMAAMEARVRSSPTSWTVVRAARLTDGPVRGSCRTGVDVALRGCWSIARADLAGYLLDHLSDVGTHRTVIEIAN